VIKEKSENSASNAEALKKAAVSLRLPPSLYPSASQAGLQDLLLPYTYTDCHSSELRVD
jgi:hypothetical protein